MNSKIAPQQFARDYEVLFHILNGQDEGTLRNLIARLTNSEISIINRCNKMDETRLAFLHFIGQFFIAICQIIAVFGIMAYVVAISPDFGVGADAAVIAIIFAVFMGFIHAFWLIVDNFATWRVAKAKAQQQ